MASPKKSFRSASLTLRNSDSKPKTVVPDSKPKKEGDSKYIPACEQSSSLGLTKRQALTEFYKKHDPSKIPEIDNLLQNYAIKDVATSLKKKYKEVPRGWEKEIKGWFG